MTESALRLVVLLLPAALLVTLLVLVLVFRRRIQERMFPGIGMREWADTVSGVSLRERWAVERANTRGRAAPLHLAAAAVQRGRRTAAMVDLMLTHGTRVRRFWLISAAFWAVVLVLAVASALSDPIRWQSWIQVGLALYWLGFVWYLIGPPQRRLRERLLRSVAANEALLAAHDDDVSPRRSSRDDAG